MTIDEIEKLQDLLDTFIGNVMPAHLETMKKAKQIVDWEATGAKSTPGQKTV